MPKGEKLRLKQMDQLPLKNFDLSKFGLLWGDFMIMGKRGSFWHLIIFYLGLSLYMPKQVSLT
jgi:hypothetical protein